jgi:hypothetical protein
MGAFIKRWNEVDNQLVAVKRRLCHDRGVAARFRREDELLGSIGIQRCPS